MRPLPPEVATVAERAEGVADVAPLRAAMAAWAEPEWRVVVVGRVSAGKSTLINALLGDPVCATGLGGVTRAITDVPLPPALVLVDTPGLDADARVPVALDAALDRADAVIWVVDGLQPVTETERRVLHAGVPAGTELRVVVSKLDLVDPSEVGPVLDRVRQLAAGWNPVAVERADLRQLAACAAADPERRPLHHVAIPGAPSHRRADGLRRALAGIRAVLDAHPEPPDVDEVRADLGEQWRVTVRAARDEVAAAIESGRLGHKHAAARMLVRVARPRREAFLATLDGDRRVQELAVSLGPVLVPMPDPPESGILGELLGGMGGAEAALRQLGARAGRWMMAGEVALDEWLAPARAATRDADRARRAALNHALDAAARALPSTS